MPKRLKSHAAVCLGLTALVALAGVRARACEPCGTKLDLPRSLEKADLVVVAKRASSTPQPEQPASGPACDELLVEEVLKGDFKGERLRARSWYGMCPYGIILGEGTYVVLLRQAVPHEYDLSDTEEECRQALKRKPELYSAVEEGCAVKALAVEAGSVKAEGVQLTLEGFRDKYGLRGGAGARVGPLFDAWPGGYWGAGLFGPAALLEVTK